MRLLLAAALLAPVAAMAHAPPNSLDPSLTGPGSISYVTMRCPCETITITPPKGNALGGFEVGVGLTVPAPRGSVIRIDGKRVR